MRVFPDVSLRGRFLLFALFGIVLPLGLVGFWLTRSAERSGVELVRRRLAESLRTGVEAFGTQWVRNMSLLIDLTESSTLVSALQGDSGWPAQPDKAIPPDLVARWDAVSPFVWLADVHDASGRLVARLPDDIRQGRFLSPSPPGFLQYDLPIRERFSGKEFGTLTVQFRGDALLLVSGLTTGAGGALVALLDRRNGTALVPLPVDDAVFNQERFTWGDDEWIALARDLVDPPVRFAVAAPLSPVTTPFAAVATRGTVALLIAVIVVFGLATLFTQRLTGSLEALSNAAAAVARGDLAARVDEDGPPSVRRTAQAFNAMSATLQDTVDRLGQQEALAAVGEFAASLAHEVRNPLTSIRMDLERAERKFDGQSPQGTVLLARALAEIDRLNASVSGVLRVARSGRVRRERVDLRVPLEAAIRAAAPRFEAKRARLDYDEPAVAAWVRGDGGALEDLMLNLLLNAADALEQEGVATIALVLEDGRAVVSVRDNGPGLTPDLLEKIFEPFYTSKDSGTGLGLAIARRIARAHGGDLEVESRPRMGTTFRFQLALLAPEPASKRYRTVRSQA